MALSEIKQAVDSGETVHWASRAYRVIHDVHEDKGGDKSRDIDQWLIICDFNGSCIGLTHRDEVTMNGREDQFFIGEGE